MDIIEFDELARKEAGRIIKSKSSKDVADRMRDWCVLFGFIEAHLEYLDGYNEKD